MSFSWSVKDKHGKDLLDEFKVDGAGYGLGSYSTEDQETPATLDDIRSAFARIPYKDKLPEAARDAVQAAQEIAVRNLMFFDSPAHEDCPTCSCKRDPKPHGVDVEALRRFLSIPLDRVWRASGGW